MGWGALAGALVGTSIVGVGAWYAYFQITKQPEAAETEERKALKHMNFIGFALPTKNITNIVEVQSLVGRLSCVPEFDFLNDLPLQERFKMPPDGRWIPAQIIDGEANFESIQMISAHYNPDQKKFRFYLILRTGWNEKYEFWLEKARGDVQDGVEALELHFNNTGYIDVDAKHPEPNLLPIIFELDLKTEIKPQVTTLRVYLSKENDRAIQADFRL